MIRYRNGLSRITGTGGFGLTAASNKTLTLTATPAVPGPRAPSRPRRRRSSRPASASPAVGYGDKHNAQQKELLETNRRLELLSITDGLTKLYNHRHLQDELARKPGCAHPLCPLGPR